MITKIRQAKDKLIAKILLRHPALFTAWEKKSETLAFNDVPWVNLEKPVAESKLALVTTGGVHLKKQEPFDMVDPNGDAGFREIPFDTPINELKITHNYYDHRNADKDINIIFPLERVLHLQGNREIGELSQYHFSFMGHILGDQLDVLRNHSIPLLIKRLKEEQVDIVVLSPA